MNLPPDDITEGWPDEPGNAELARFAEQLHASLPRLPEDALGRVEQKLHQELAAKPAPRSRRLLWASLAAAVLLSASVGLYLVLKPGPVPDPNRGPLVEHPSPPPELDDRYSVELAVSPASVHVERSVVRLDEYRSLFTD